MASYKRIMNPKSSFFYLTVCGACLATVIYLENIRVKGINIINNSSGSTEESNFIQPKELPSNPKEVITLNSFLE